MKLTSNVELTDEKWSVMVLKIQFKRAIWGQSYLARLFVKWSSVALCAEPAHAKSPGICSRLPQHLQSVGLLASSKITADLLILTSLIRASKNVRCLCPVTSHVNAFYGGESAWRA